MTRLKTKVTSSKSHRVELTSDEIDDIIAALNLVIGDRCCSSEEAAPWRIILEKLSAIDTLSQVAA